MEDLDRIIAEHAESVWRAAYRLLGSTADADECMQDAFVEAFHVNRRMNVRNWGAMLRRIATMRALDYLRHRLAAKPQIAGRTQCEDLPWAGDPPSARAERGELRDLLRQALSRLPVQQAQIFCLRHIEEMSYEDIADQMQVSVNSVGAILNRARERLRELLGEYGKATGKTRCQL